MEKGFKQVMKERLFLGLGGCGMQGSEGSVWMLQKQRN